MAISLHVSASGITIRRREFFVDLTISEYEKLTQLSDDISKSCFEEQENMFHLSDTAEINSRMAEGRKILELMNFKDQVQVLIFDKDEWFALDKYFMICEMGLGKEVYKKFLIKVVEQNMYRVCDGCLQEQAMHSNLHQCLRRRKECANKILASSALTKISVPRFIKKLAKEAYLCDYIVQYPVAIYKRVILHYKSHIKQIVLDMYSNEDET